MGLLDAVDEAHGGQAAQSLAQAFNVDPAQAQAVLEAVMPKLTQGLESMSLSQGGLASILGTLQAGTQHEATLDAPGGLTAPAVQAHGVAVLDTVLGGKSKVDSLSYQAAAGSGIEGAIIRQMLPTIAAMAMRGLAARAGGSLGSVLGQLPGVAAGSASGGGVYGEIGKAIARGASGGAASAARNVIGASAGFPTRGGWMGWLVRLIVIRIGWGIVRSLIRGAVLGRAGR